MEKKTQFVISTECFDSIFALEKRIQGKVQEFIKKFQNNSTTLGIHFEKIPNGVDNSFYSVRIDQAYRGIVVKQEGVNMLLWVDHHDEAYEWAKRKKCIINKATGGVQIYEVEHVAAPEERTASEYSFSAGLFSRLSDEVLTRMGVPEEQFALVRKIQNFEEFRSRRNYIPIDAFEGLEMIYQGEAVEDVLDIFFPITYDADVSDYVAALHSDASRRSFVVVDGETDLEEIMKASLEKWRVFLHPMQRRIVEKNYSGPARVLGGAGTGKTVVAMHRAQKLAATTEGRILFTTFTKNLADDIRENLKKICSSEEMNKIEVVNLDAWASSFLNREGESGTVLFGKDLDAVWDLAIKEKGTDQSIKSSFYKNEWRLVVQPQDAYAKELYKKASRKGRGSRLDPKKKESIWAVLEEYQKQMEQKNAMDSEMVIYACRKLIAEKYPNGLYTSVIVDEGQDLSPGAFRLVRALAGVQHENDVFIVGDAHQRIYQNKAVLSQCGIQIRGRNEYLRLNYRTTEETRKYAFALLDGVRFDDLDEAYDNGAGVHSLTHGEKPTVKICDTFETELAYIIEQIKELEKSGVELKDICIVSRTHKQLSDYMEGLKKEKIRFYEIKSTKIDDRSLEGVRVATMHRVKGLEFDHVFVAGVNKAGTNGKNLPARTEEKCLLYVALTRARKCSYISCYGELSDLIKTENA